MRCSLAHLAATRRLAPYEIGQGDKSTDARHSETNSSESFSSIAARVHGLCRTRTHNTKARRSRGSFRIVLVKDLIHTESKLFKSATRT